MQRQSTSGSMDRKEGPYEHVRREAVRLPGLRGSLQYGREDAEEPGDLREGRRHPPGGGDQSHDRDRAAHREHPVPQVLLQAGPSAREGDARARLPERQAGAAHQLRDAPAAEDGVAQAGRRPKSKTKILLFSYPKID